MLKAIKCFFDTHISAESTEGTDPQHAIRLAVAVLLVEVAEADYQDHPEERDALELSIQHQFGLAEAEANELIALARSEHADSTDYFQFTSLINSQFDADQKVKIIEGLWRIAFADNQLHHYEEHVIRRLADLLHVSHGKFIAAKHRVLNQSLQSK